MVGTRTKPALQSFIEDFVGGNYVVEVATVTVTTTPTRVLSNDFERMAAVIINTGATDCKITPSNVVTTTLGIVLGNGGGNLSMSANEDLALVGWDWYALTASSTTTLTVMTIKRYNPGVS